MSLTGQVTQSIEKMAAMDVRPPLTEVLKRRESQLRAELADVQNALRLLDENPKFVLLLDALGRVGGGIRGF